MITVYNVNLKGHTDRSTQGLTHGYQTLMGRISTRTSKPGFSQPIGAPECPKGFVEHRAQGPVCRDSDQQVETTPRNLHVPQAPRATLVHLADGSDLRAARPHSTRHLRPHGAEPPAASPEAFQANCCLKAAGELFIFNILDVSTLLNWEPKVIEISIIH